MPTTIDVTPTEASTYPASSVAPTEAVANLVAEGLDPGYTGMPASAATPWWVFALLALAIYFVWGEDF